MRFIRCRSCGKYLNARDAVARAYCSQECMGTYASCVTCGTYFPSGTGFDAEHCSKDCVIKYEIFRKYGPEPVTVVTEV